MTPLPPPEVLECYSDVGFMPPIQAMRLRWPAEAESARGPWRLPNGDPLEAPLPRRFGVRIYRQSEDAYAVALLWDADYWQWFALRRHEVLASALGVLLASLGGKLEGLLDLPPNTAITSAA